MMNNVRGRALFVNSAFPKPRSASTPPALEHVIEERGSNQNVASVMPSYGAIRQLAVGAFYTQRLKDDTSSVLDLLEEHIALLEGGGTQDALHGALEKLIEEILTVYPVDDRHQYLLSPVALSCVKQFDHVCERVLENFVRSGESANKEELSRVLNDQKSQLAILKSFSSVLTVDRRAGQAKQNNKEVHTELKEMSTQSTTEMASQEVQATSAVRQAQVQTERVQNVTDAATQSRLKMHSQATQSKPNVRASQMQTDKLPLANSSTQYVIGQGEFATQTTQVASALTKDEWDQMRQTLTAMPVELGKKIEALFNRKKSAAISIDTAQHLVAPYSTAFDHLEQYIKGQSHLTKEISADQQQMITQLCDCLHMIDRYRAMTFAAIFPIEEGARHNGLQALAKELEHLRYQRAAPILQFLQVQDQGRQPDASLARLTAMKPDVMPWALHHKNQFNHILDQLHENLEDYVLGLEGKLANYQCELTEQSILHATVDEFLPLVAQVKIAAFEATANTHEKLGLDVYSQFLNACHNHLSGLVNRLIPKLKGENKEQDTRMLNALNKIIQPVSKPIKEAEAPAFSPPNSVKLPAPTKGKRQDELLPDFLTRMEGVHKWDEYDLCLIGRVVNKVLEDMYKVQFYNRQAVSDGIWPQFQSILKLGVNVKASHKALIERKKKNKSLTKLHESILALYRQAFDVALEVYPGRAKEISTLRQIG